MPLPGMGGMTAQQLNQQVAQGRRGERNPQTKWQKNQATMRQGPGPGMAGPGPVPAAETYTKPQPTDRPTTGAQQVAMQPGVPSTPTTRPSQPVPGMSPAMPQGLPQSLQANIPGGQAGVTSAMSALPAFGAFPQSPIPQKPVSAQLGAMMRGY